MAGKLDEPSALTSESANNSPTNSPTDDTVVSGVESNPKSPDTPAPTSASDSAGAEQSKPRKKLIDSSLQLSYLRLLVLLLMVTMLVAIITLENRKEKFIKWYLAAFHEVYLNAYQSNHFTPKDFLKDTLVKGLPQSYNKRTGSTTVATAVSSDSSIKSAAATATDTQNDTPSHSATAMASTDSTATNPEDGIANRPVTTLTSVEEPLTSTDRSNHNQSATTDHAHKSDTNQSERNANAASANSDHKLTNREASTVPMRPSVPTKKPSVSDQDGYTPQHYSEKAQQFLTQFNQRLQEGFQRIEQQSKQGAQRFQESFDRNLEQLSKEIESRQNTLAQNSEEFVNAIAKQFSASNSKIRVQQVANLVDLAQSMSAIQPASQHASQALSNALRLVQGQQDPSTAWQTLATALEQDLNMVKALAQPKPDEALAQLQQLAEHIQALSFSSSFTNDAAADTVDDQPGFWQTFLAGLPKALEINKMEDSAQTVMWSLDAVAAFKKEALNQIAMAQLAVMRGDQTAFTLSLGLIDHALEQATTEEVDRQAIATITSTLDGLRNVPIVAPAFTLDKSLNALAALRKP